MELIFFSSYDGDPGGTRHDHDREAAEKYQRVTREDRRQVKENTRKREVGTLHQYNDRCGVTIDTVLRMVHTRRRRFVFFFRVCSSIFVQAPSIGKSTKRRKIDVSNSLYPLCRSAAVLIVA